jgi:hypothetical protein
VTTAINPTTGLVVGIEALPHRPAHRCPALLIESHREPGHGATRYREGPERSQDRAGGLSALRSAIRVSLSTRYSLIS